MTIRNIVVPDQFKGNENIGFDVRFGFVDLVTWEVLKSVRVKEGESLSFSYPVEVVDLSDQMITLKSKLDDSKISVDELIIDLQESSKDVDIYKGILQELTWKSNDIKTQLLDAQETLRVGTNNRNNLQHSLNHAELQAKKNLSILERVGLRFSKFMTKSDIKLLDDGVIGPSEKDLEQFGDLGDFEQIVHDVPKPKRRGRPPKNKT